MVPVPYTRDDARTYLRHIIPGGWETDREWGFVVEARDDAGVPRFAGTISLRNMGEGRAEIAYGSHPWVRGRGVMERALRLLLDWGFAERDLHTVLWLARRGNWASRRLAWRLGFSVEGTLRDWLPQRGVLVDAWVGTFGAASRCHRAVEWLLAPRIVGDSVVLRANAEADLPRPRRGDQRPAGAEVQPDPPRARAPRRGEGARASARPPRGGRPRRVGDWTVADARTDELLGWVALFGIQPRPRGRGRLLGAPRRSRPRCGHRGLQAGRPARVRRHARTAGWACTGSRRTPRWTNLASCRVLERAGFTRFGVERGSTQLPDGT